MRDAPPFVYGRILKQASGFDRIRAIGPGEVDWIVNRWQHPESERLAGLLQGVILTYPGLELARYVDVDHGFCRLARHWINGAHLGSPEAWQTHSLPEGSDRTWMHRFHSALQALINLYGHSSMVHGKVCAKNLIVPHSDPLSVVLTDLDLSPLLRLAGLSSPSQERNHSLDMRALAEAFDPFHPAEASAWLKELLKGDPTGLSALRDEVQEALGKIKNPWLELCFDTCVIRHLGKSRSDLERELTSPKENGESESIYVSKDEQYGPQGWQLRIGNRLLRGRWEANCMGSWQLKIMTYEEITSRTPANGDFRLLPLLLRFSRSVGVGTKEDHLENHWLRSRSRFKNPLANQLHEEQKNQHKQQRRSLRELLTSSLQTWANVERLVTEPAVENIRIKKAILLEDIPDLEQVSMSRTIKRGNWATFQLEISATLEDLQKVQQLWKLVSKDEFGSSLRLSWSYTKMSRDFGLMEKKSQIVEILGLVASKEDKSRLSILIDYHKEHQFMLNHSTTYTIQLSSSPARKKSMVLQCLNEGKVCNPQVIDAFFHPHEVHANPAPFGPLELPQLNGSQAKAFAMAMGSPELAIVQGPPGTGKTRFITALLEHQRRARPGMVIAVSSQSNEAVSNVLERLENQDAVVVHLRDSQFTSLAVEEVWSRWKNQCLEIMGRAEERARQFVEQEEVRLLDAKAWKNLEESLLRSRAPEGAFSQTVLNHLSSQIEVEQMEAEEELLKKLQALQALEELQSKWKLILGEEMDQCHGIQWLLDSPLIFGTLMGGIPHITKNCPEVELGLSILDEAGKADPLEMMNLMIRSRSVILVGDERQLPPHLDKLNREIMLQEGVPFEHTTSIFAQLIDKADPENLVFLDEQNRMTPSIGSLVSKLFYKGQLKTGPHVPEPLADGFPTIEHVDVGSGPESYAQQILGEKSWYNNKEVEKVMELLKRWIPFAKELPKGIGVITPYAAQRMAIEQAYGLLKLPENFKVSILTVDASQGREYDIIVLSMVHCSEEYKPYTFMEKDAPRVNVALSRARRKLVIVGAMDYLRWVAKKGGLLEKILK